MSVLRQVPKALSLALVAAAAACDESPSSVVGTEIAAAVSMGCLGPDRKTEDLLECVTIEGVREHQAALQAIADDNSDDRSFLSNFWSADYVASVLSDAGYQATQSMVTIPHFSVVGIPVLEQTSPTATEYVWETDYDIFNRSDGGDVTAAVTPVDLTLGGTGGTSTSGCEIEDFAGFPAGNIALLQRGACTFLDKVANAAAAGASGVIIFNNFDNLISGSLTDANEAGIPVVSTTYARGVEWAETSGLVMHMEFEVIGDLTSFQVIAESGRGDPGNVVLVGGYLDTFIGPGINSNGSGVAAILETAEQLAGVETRNRVRFAFWTGGGFVTSGSTAYVNSLSQAELDAIALYIDVRSIGSPNYARFVLDGDVSSPSLEAPPGSEAIASFFTDFYTSRGLTSEPLLGTSDYSVFSGVGIPVGGISAGSDGTKTELQAAVYGGTAGSPFDPCFQAACDTYDNVSLEILDLNSDAIAAATLAFAMSTESVNGVKGHGRFKPGTRGSPVSNQVTR